MNFASTPIPGVNLISATQFSDDRGTFWELFAAREFGALRTDPVVRPPGYLERPRQVNACLSRKAGTIRGMHWQAPPFGQAKAVFCLEGAIWDVAVKLAPGYPHFGVRLAPGAEGLFIPEGFAHGYQALEDGSKILYLIFGNSWKRDAERGARFDDPKIGIRWPREATAVSERDRSWPLL